MTTLYKSWLEAYPIVSIEDGLGENDWEGFREHTSALGDKTQIVGDDIYVTNTQFITRGIKEKTTNDPDIFDGLCPCFISACPPWICKK